MANIAKWNTPTVSTILSTELNSLVSSTAATSTAISNDTGLNLFVDVELYCAAFSPTAGGAVIIYLLESVDGTNYPSQSTADLRQTWTQLLCYLFTGAAAATEQRVVARNCIIPPGKFKVVLDNQTNTNFAASGSTLKFSTYNVNLNG